MPSGDFSILIITSANALNMLKQQGFDQSMLNIPLYVVGDSTEQKAKTFGFRHVQSASGNSMNLVDLLNSRSIISQSGKKPALYICGKNSTAGFTDALTKNGLKFKTLINYKANLVNQLTDKSVDLLLSGKPVGVLLYSARSAGQFSALLSKLDYRQPLDNIKIFALSNAVKCALPKQLQNVTYVADNPNESSLFSLISR